MKTALVPLAPGFEELEAIAIIDVLRRANIHVTTAALREREVSSVRHVRVLADTLLDAVKEQDFDLVVLPGGGPGSKALAEDSRVIDLLCRQHQEGRWVAAVCAAPQALAVAGLLRGRRVTSYPGVLDDTPHPDYCYLTDAVVTDGHIITSRGPGTVLTFALTLVEKLLDKATAQQIAKAMLVNGF